MCFSGQIQMLYLYLYKQLYKDTYIHTQISKQNQKKDHVKKELLKTATYCGQRMPPAMSVKKDAAATEPSAVTLPIPHPCGELRIEENKILARDS